MRFQIFKDMNSTVRFIAGFLLGSTLGLAAGLLAAPSTGKQTRKRLSKKSRKLAKQLAGYVGMEEKFQVSAASKRKNGRTPVQA